MAISTSATFRWACGLLLLSGWALLSRTHAADPATVVRFHLSDADDASADEEDESGTESAVVPASWIQPAPAVLPAQSFLPGVMQPAAARDLFGSLGVPGSMFAARRTGGLTADVVFGAEAQGRVTTDAGNLLGKSPRSLGVEAQRRTPIVTDPRIRGNRVGSLAASGSHWVPARIDLDTMLSKIDSRIVEQVTVIKGPYSVWYGPGFEFHDVELKSAPRYPDGWELHGATSLEYKTNGEALYGRQTLWGGDADWGFRAGYGHRTGNDYRSGNGTEVPASYKSGDWDVALAYGQDAQRLEFSYLRLDQTDVEFPGQAFDIDYLVTDGYGVKYVDESLSVADRLAYDVWYNRTRFNGSAQRPGKRRQFPFYDLIDFVGFTDVDSMSLGHRFALTWGEEGCRRVSAGTDLRYVKQELNEITSGRIGINLWTNANSPIPKSDALDPGLFVEWLEPVSERLRLRSGARVDSVQARVIDDPVKLATLGTGVPPSSLAAILGTPEFDQSFSLWAAHLTAEFDINDCWTASWAGGYAERAPTLTELYAAQSFMFLLQNGLNTVTGDPRLDKEQRWQLDAGLSYDDDRLRGSVTGFHAWVRDYITFENLGTFPPFPAMPTEQVKLKYVNTELATLTGLEFRSEYDTTDWLTPFATLKYVAGRDHTRRGTFATEQNSPIMPSRRVVGLPRGFFSGVSASVAEPLPGIAPLEARIGVRLREPEAGRWGTEFMARIVDRQDRVASSLLESPTPGFTVFDVRGYWRATDGLLVVAGVENLGNRTYREHLDFRSPSGIQVFQPGVNAYAGIERTY